MGVPQDHLSVAGRHAQLLEQRRGGMPKVMDLDHPELVVVTDPAERADQVPGLDGQTAAGAEHQAGVLPGPPERLAVSDLLFLAAEQRGAGQARDGQVSVARLGLDWSSLQAAADPLELLADPEHAVVQVHVLPAQAEDFTAAHAVEQQQDERGVERVWLSCLQEGQGLVGRPGVHLSGFPCGQLDEPGDVPADEFLTSRAGQGRAENLAHHVDIAHRLAFGQLAERLRSDRHLLILDNAESITATPTAIPHALSGIEQQKLKALVSRLRGGRTLLLLGSREAEAWLTSASGGPSLYPLPGLDPQAASILVERILGRYGAGHFLDDNVERTALQELVTLLDGYPLPLTVVLPALASSPPSKVLGELREGSADADPVGLIHRAIEYSYGKLDPALQNSLLLLAPFTEVIGIGPILERYQELLHEDETVRELGPVDLAAAVSQAVTVGLAAPHAQLTNMMLVQPVLPYFLRSRLQDQPDLRDRPPAGPIFGSTVTLALHFITC